jgi:glycosyltransferase involved in cell wall biosynthesis
MPVRSRTALAICMATRNPRRDLLERQIASIRAQSVTDWRCVISDDGSERRAIADIESVLGGDRRFELVHGQPAVGFYRNFERALQLAPADAPLVALADQDDVWSEHRLERMIPAFESPETILAVCAMRVVDEAGVVVSDKAPFPRRHDLAAQIAANRVTGAASVFRRELLDVALPFPDLGEAMFHDHWIGCVAAALGTIGIVDEPLVDYVQHAANVIGYGPSRRVGLAAKVGSVSRGGIGQIRSLLGTWPAIYERQVLQAKAIGCELERRIGPRAEATRRAVMRRYATIDASWGSFCWLAASALRNLAGTPQSERVENTLLRGVIWKRTIGRNA